MMEAEASDLQETETPVPPIVFEWGGAGSEIQDAQMFP